MDLAARVAAEPTAWKPDAIFVDAGRGEGVIDRLRQLGYSVIEVNFGGKPTDDAYLNKRSERPPLNQPLYSRSSAALGLNRLNMLR